MFYSCAFNHKVGCKEVIKTDGSSIVPKLLLLVEVCSHSTLYMICRKYITGVLLIVNWSVGNCFNSWIQQGYIYIYMTEYVVGLLMLT
jgi:hypothetical protein